MHSTTSSNSAVFMVECGDGGNMWKQQLSFANLEMIPLKNVHLIILSETCPRGVTDEWNIPPTKGVFAMRLLWDPDHPNIYKPSAKGTCDDLGDENIRVKGFSLGKISWFIAWFIWCNQLKSFKVPVLVRLCGWLSITTLLSAYIPQTDSTQSRCDIPWQELWLPTGTLHHLSRENHS